jgi:hypothetical protein
MKTKFDELGFIIAYESGECNTNEIIEGFSYLIKNGHAFSFQGHYGRMAYALIEKGYISKEGKILQYSE